MKNNMKNWFAGLLAVSVFAVGAVKAPADSIIVANPSFEDNSNGGVGYGSISGWTGGSGTNNSGQPFADNGIIPDRTQVAFLQGDVSLSQSISGLDTTKQYWLQAWVNSRDQSACCGYPDATVKYNAVTLVGPQTVPAVQSSGINTLPYYFVNIPFIPSAASGNLEVSSALSSGATDTTLLLDGISVIQRDADQVVIKNPSFEASGVTGGIGQFSPIAGWTTGGGAGVNNASQPFAAGTAIPDGNNVAIQQGSNTISQTIDNLTLGAAYELKFYYNARIGTEDLSLNATIGALTALNTVVTPSGTYSLATYIFAPTATSMPLTFASSAGTGPGIDYTLLVDNVSIRVIPEPSSLALLAFGGAIMGLFRRRRDK